MFKLKKKRCTVACKVIYIFQPLPVSISCIEAKFLVVVYFFQLYLEYLFACHGQVKFPPQVNFNSIKSWMRINCDFFFVERMLKTLNARYWSREFGSSTDFNEDFSETC